MTTLVNSSTHKFTGRHALITGANRGIGLAIATVLSAGGAHVTLMVRDRHAGIAVQDGLAGGSTIVTADVTNDTEVQNACAEAISMNGPVHFLVNNAGSVESAPFAASSTSLFQRMLAVHLYGPLYCTHALLPGMLTVGFGRIVNIASIAGLVGAPYVSAYVSAKHALVGLTRSLAKEVTAKGVTVNAVCPGYTDTDLVSRGIDVITKRTGRSATEAGSMLLAGNPLQRLVTPGEVASAVEWLCSDGAASITGQTIVVDGGQLA